jgi:hypothetical protein
MIPAAVSYKRHRFRLLLLPVLSGYAPVFLQSFAFRSARRHDPLLAAIETLKLLYKDGRRTLPSRFPIGHLREQTRKLISVQSKPDRRLYEIATLAVLRDRLRSADVWVEGSPTH